MNNMTENNTEKNEHKTYVNYDIFPGKIRLITKEGKSIVLDRDTAIDMAKKDRMDLVQVGYNKNSSPKSVCKIISYSKMKYEQKKREKEEKRKAKLANAEAKEVIFSIRIDVGDKNTKINHIRKFIIDDNMKVKISIKLSKREMNLLGMAKDLMYDILSNIEDIAELDSNPSFMSGIMSCTIRRKK